MTPAERVAELRRLYESDKCWSSTDLTRAENTERLLLAIAEAVPAALDAGHDNPCLLQAMFNGGRCTCGRGALAAAWAALGDDHGR